MENNLIASNQKPIKKKKGNLQSHKHRRPKWPPHKITISQNHGFWETLTCKSATPLRPDKIEGSKFNIKFLTTSPNKHSEDFLKFCIYVEKIDIEGGPR